MRKILATGTLAGALLAGGAAGAMLFGAATANAQDPAASAAPAASTAPTTGTDGGPGAPGPGGPGGGRMTVEAVTDASVVAGVFGISEADLTTAMNGGQTIAAIAKAHGVDVQKVIDALVADSQSELDAAVKAGTLTQAQADAQKAGLTQHATDQVNGTHTGR